MFSGTVCTLGISNEFQHIDESVTTLARERGNVLFRLIELTRDWNAARRRLCRVTEQTPTQFPASRAASPA